MKKTYTKPVLTSAAILSKMTALETCPSYIYEGNASVCVVEVSNGVSNGD